ncbi:hypothetical protein SCLCIDRAFT_74281, partial [Scleroderma citrinum Foug A]
LNFALIWTSEKNPSTDGTGLEGWLFTSELFKTPLAYIEWFTPFHVHDPNSGMFVVSRSTRMHQAFVEVIPIERVVCSCHLIPDFGDEMDQRWTPENV